MPYIKQSDRDAIAEGVIRVRTSGELNFTFTFVINEYLKTNGLSYGTINNVMGALEGASVEFYRRVAAPYEDKKRAENGDVYDPRFVL